MDPGKHADILAKNIARVILMMRLGPASTLNDGDVFGDSGRWPLEPNNENLQQQCFSWTFIFLFMFFTLPCVSPYRVYRVASNAFSSLEPLRIDIAVMEVTCDSMRQCKKNIPCGFIHMGGCTNV